MLIECITKREGPTEINLRGSTRYVFEKNEYGHYVCNVLVGGDREYLLALEKDFRIYEPPKEQAAPTIDDKVLALSAEGLKPGDIADQLGLTPQKVGMILKRLKEVNV